MPASDPHLFDIQIFPAKNLQIAGDHISAWVLGKECEISGWMLPAENGTNHGIRAYSNEIAQIYFTAKRKQLRPDVYFNHPQHPEAVQSGFRVSVLLHSGKNCYTLKYKDSSGKWQPFCTLQLRVPPFWRWLQRFMPRDAVTGYEAWCKRQDQKEQRRATAVLKELPNWPRHPKISVLLPVYNTPKIWLERAIQSVIDQSYPHWELCIADDHSSEPHIRPLLESYTKRDSRIRVVFREKNGHICHASNSALELCTGEFTALFDHDDELPRHALLRVAEELLMHPDANLIFSDEDKIDIHGVRSDPYFKLGANLELLFSENCISHLGVFRTSLIKQIGGFRPGFEGSQDWDLTLRVVNCIDRSTIRHIPQILYHWRTLETSTASKQSSKPYAIEAGLKAVRANLEQTFPTAILPDQHPHHIHWPIPNPAPLVSIIIPTKDRVDLLKVAVETLLTKTAYSNYELVIVDHASSEAATLEYFESIRHNPSIKIHRTEGEFNWSRLNNFGVEHSSGHLLLFLNNDVEIINSDWLGELVANACRPGVGAVGASLLYPAPNQSIQHAGVVLRLMGVAGHPFQGMQPHARTIAGNPSAPREVTAVTGACLMVSRENFLRAGGFDADQLPISYNDIDFCLRLRSFGLRNLYASHAVLIHHESASRRTLEKEAIRKAAATAEAQILLNRWPEELAQDTFYNPNLTLFSPLPATKEQEEETQSTTSSSQ